MFRYDCGEGFY